jgi:hypothetical protein
VAFTPAAFTPSDGLLNVSSFPTNPADETAARTQVQTLLTQLKTALNLLMTELARTTDGVSGSDNIGMTAISGLTGTTIQAVVESLVTTLKSVTDSASGADFVGTTTISGVTGNTVQAVIESLITNLKAVTDSASGADFIGSTAISGLTGTTVQALLESLKTYIDTTALAFILGVIPDNSLTTAKMATEQKRGSANGVASLDTSGYVPLSQLGNVPSNTVPYGRYQGDYGFIGATLSSTTIYNEIGRLSEGVLSSATYDSKSKGIGSQETDITGITFNSDGSKMYIVGTANDTIYQYTLGTAWDVSTASYASKSFSVNSQDGTPTCVRFSTDGSKMYISGNTNDTVYQYTLSTPWDVSTASYASKSFSVSSQESAVRGLDFSTDGTKMYIVGTANDTIYQYTLGTAWDVSTASYASKSFSVSSLTLNPYDLSFTNNGYSVYIVDYTNNYIYEIYLTTAWDISTAFITGNQKYVGSQSLNPECLFVKPDGTKFYIADVTLDSVEQFSMTGLSTSGTTTKTSAPIDLDNWGSFRCYVSGVGTNNSATVTIKDASDNVLIAATTLTNGWNNIGLSAISASTYTSIKTVYTFARNAYTDSSVVITNASVTYEGSNRDNFPVISDNTYSSTMALIYIPVPVGYTDLELLIYDLVTSSSGNTLNMRFNNDSGSVYDHTVVANTTVATSAATNVIAISRNVLASTNKYSGIVRITNVTDKYKTVQFTGICPDTYPFLGAGSLKDSTNAITSIQLYCSNTITSARIVLRGRK